MVKCGLFNFILFSSKALFVNDLIIIILTFYVVQKFGCSKMIIFVQMKLLYNLYF